MAVTVSAADVGDLPYYIVGNQKKTVKDVTLTGTYATGGVEITASDLGLNYIDTVEVEIQTAANSADSLTNTQSNIDSTKGHIDVELWEETPAEITNADTVTGTVLRITAYGH